MTDPEATAPPVPARRGTDLPPDAPWWAHWLVENAKDAWRWASVRFGVLVAIGAEVYAADPADFQQVVANVVPASWWPHLLALGGLASIALRVVNLKGKP